LNKKGQQLEALFEFVNKMMSGKQTKLILFQRRGWCSFFELPCQESPKHQRVAAIDSKMCGEIQVQDNSPECPKDNSIPIKQESYSDFVEAVQVAPPEMEDGGQATIDELREINLGTADDPRPIFVSAVMNDEEMA